MSFQFSVNQESWKIYIIASIKILSITTDFNIDNITIISKGSSDTEDWLNDAENSALSSQE